MSEQEIIRVYVRGPFRIEGPDGELLTPKGAKAQGLLLLLLLSPHGERMRRWVQDKLWSDRDAEHGAGSLRQTLARIRASLGAHAGVLQSDRARIRLDLSRIAVDNAASGELAEGIDVCDPEFEEWLTLERAAAEDEAAAPARWPEGEAGGGADSGANGGTQEAPVAEILPVERSARRSFGASAGVSAGVSGGAPARSVIVSAGPCEQADMHWLCELVADAVALGLREQMACTVLRRPAGRAGHMLLVRIDGFRMGANRGCLRAALDENMAGNQEWSGHRMIDLQGAPPVDDPMVQQLICEICDAVHARLPVVGAGLALRPGGDLAASFGETFGDGPETADPDALCRAAIGHIFSMQPPRLLLAETLLKRAIEIEPRGLFYAWLAQIQIVQHVERHHGDRSDFRAEGEYFAHLAREIEPRSSMVMAISANVKQFLCKDTLASFEFADLGVRLNPANPMALWSRSNAQLYSGRAREAYIDALRGRLLSASSQHRYFWDLQQGAAALVLGRLPEATRLFERVTALCPTFRPPRRYLTALYAHDGRAGDAVAQSGQLARLEPDFTVDRLWADHAYPASLLRRTDAFDMARLIDFGNEG